MKTFEAVFPVVSVYPATRRSLCRERPFTINHCQPRKPAHRKERKGWVVCIYISTRTTVTLDRRCFIVREPCDSVAFSYRTSLIKRRRLRSVEFSSGYYYIYLYICTEREREKESKKEKATCLLFHF